MKGGISVEFTEELKNYIGKGYDENTGPPLRRVRAKKQPTMWTYIKSEVTLAMLGLPLRTITWFYQRRFVGQKVERA